MTPAKQHKGEKGFNAVEISTGKAVDMENPDRATSIDHGDCVTILEVTGQHCATKVHTRLNDGSWDTKSHSRSVLNEFREAPISNIFSLASVINALTEREYPIRGAIHVSKTDRRGKKKKYFRATLDNFGGHRGATPCRWVMIDLDNVELGAGLDIFKDPEAAIRWAITKYLPKCFHGVTCFWQLSSSAGVKKGFSAHIWFWLDRKIPGGDLSDYLAAEGGKIDTSMLRNDVQPHYCAPPIFTNTKDPIPHRQAVMAGSNDAVEVPLIQPRVLRLKAKARGAINAVLDDAKDIGEALALIGDGEGLAGFHAPINKAVMRAVSAAGAQELDRDGLKARIREAVYARKSTRSVSYIENATSDHYLDSSINGAALWLQRKNEIKEAKAHYPLVAGSLDDAELMVEEYLETFSADVAEYWREHEATEEENERRKTAEEYPLLAPDLIPERLLLTPTGTGKSRAARLVIPDILKQNPGKTIVVAVPMHMLGAEYLNELEQPLKEAGFSVGAFRGRGADDLSAPTGETGPQNTFEKMCRLHKEASELMAAGGDVETQMCAKGRKNTKKRKECRYFHTCGYQRQKEEHFNVTLIAHQLLTSQKPKSVGDPAAVFVDEDPLATFVAGIGPKPASVSVDEIHTVENRLKRLAGAARRKRETKRANGMDAARFAVADVRKALLTIGDGEVNRRDLGRALFKNTTSGTITEKLSAAYRGVWKALKELDVKPGMEPKRRAAKIASVAGYNKTIRRVARLFKILHQLLEQEGERNLVDVHTDDDLKEYWERLKFLKANNNKGGAPLKPPPTDEERETESTRLGLHDTSIIPGIRKDDDQITISWIKEKRKGWNVPTMYMDATGREEVYKALAPNIDAVCHVECRAFHMHVRQVVDWNASRNKLAPGDHRTDKQNKTAINNVRKIARIIEARAAEFRGQGAVVGDKAVDVLVITHKPTRDSLEVMGLPDNVEFAHYGNLTGLDRWKGVRYLALVGGAAKGVAVVEQMAELLKGDKLDPVNSAFGNWYAQEKVGGRRRGEDTGPELVRDFHNDPVAEAVRWQLTEGHMIQALGRGREVRRTAENPLQVDVIANVPLPFEVDEFVKWTDIQPTYRDTLAARGVVIDAETTARGYWETVAAALPDVYVSAAAARNQNMRSRAHLLIKYTIYTDERVRDENDISAPPNFSSWGHAKVRVKRYSIPVRFAPGCDLAGIFGPDAKIKITYHPPDVEV